MNVNITMVEFLNKIKQKVYGIITITLLQNKNS